MDLLIEKINKNAKIPTYATEFSAAADIYACIDEKIIIKPNEVKLIPTGFKLAIPQGYGGFIYARSGLSCKRGLALATKVSIIDSDYRGEWFIPLHNFGIVEQVIAPNDRIAQLVVAPYLKVGFVEGKLDSTERGEGGFGHSGK